MGRIGGYSTRAAAPRYPGTVHDGSTPTICYDGASIAVPLLCTPSSAGYPTQVAAQVGRYVAGNAAVGGQTIAQMSARYAANVKPLAVLSPKPVLVVEGGYNDLIDAATPAALWSAMAAYIATAQGDGFRVVLCTMLSADGCAYVNAATYETYRLAYNARARAAGVAVIADIAPLVVSRNLDLIHPDAAGHATMVPVIAAAVQLAGAG